MGVTYRGDWGEREGMSVGEERKRNAWGEYGGGE